MDAQKSEATPEAGRYKQYGELTWQQVCQVKAMFCAMSAHRYNEYLYEIGYSGSVISRKRKAEAR